MRCHVRSGLNLADFWSFQLKVGDSKYWGCGYLWIFAESFCLELLLVLEREAEGRVVGATDSSPSHRHLPKNYRRR